MLGPTPQGGGLWELRRQAGKPPRRQAGKKNPTPPQGGSDFWENPCLPQAGTPPGGATLLKKRPGEETVIRFEFIQTNQGEGR